MFVRWPVRRRPPFSKIFSSGNDLPNAFYFVVLVVKMPEMVHDWLNKIILFYFIIFYSTWSVMAEYP